MKEKLIKPFGGFCCVFTKSAPHWKTIQYMLYKCTDTLIPIIFLYIHNNI